MKVLGGFVLGLLTVFLLGAVTDTQRLEVRGEFEKVGVYETAFSGITLGGGCYLAVTNTITGRTEIVGIPKDAITRIGSRPFKVTTQGTAIVELSR
jgi:hypothetical protein